MQQLLQISMPHLNATVCLSPQWMTSISATTIPQTTTMATSATAMALTMNDAPSDRCVRNRRNPYSGDGPRVKSPHFLISPIGKSKSDKRGRRLTGVDEVNCEVEVLCMFVYFG